VKRILSIFLLFSAGFSCETELDPNTRISSIPVVYGLFNDADSVFYIRLGRTFQTDTNIQEYEIPADSLIWPNAQISLERWFQGKFVEKETFIQVPNVTRDTGFFPSNPYQIFILEKGKGNSDYTYSGISEDLRLIVDLQYKPIVYSEFFLISPVAMATPRNSGNTYNMFDFSVIFKAYSNYTEMYVRIHYLNRYADNFTTETASWREFHDHDIVDRGIGKDFKIPLEGVALYERIGNNIPDDTAVINRKFEYAEIIINCLDENVYRYNESQRTIPSDQAGRLFTNVVNGMGVVGSRYNRTISFLFDHRSIVELCTGEYTKHLKFVDW